MLERGFQVTPEQAQKAYPKARRAFLAATGEFERAVARYPGDTPFPEELRVRLRDRLRRANSQMLEVMLALGVQP
jgi:hypothetical protein